MEGIDVKEEIIIEGIKLRLRVPPGASMINVRNVAI